MVFAFKSKSQNNEGQCSLNLNLDSVIINLKLDNTKRIGILKVENKMRKYSIPIDSALFYVDEIDERCSIDSIPSYLHISNVFTDDFSKKSRLMELVPGKTFVFYFKFNNEQKFWNCFLDIYLVDFKGSLLDIKDIITININNFNLE